jgi:hypothetical protein
MEYKMNVELTYKEVWATLNALDLSEYHDKKGNFTYLSWTDAWKILMEHYAFATYEFQPETYENNGTVMSHCIVRIGHLERYMWLPCMDNRNNSVANPTTRQIQDSRMRCLVKCLAMFGLANYIFRGEDLPDADKDVAEAQVTQEVQEVESETETGFRIKELNGNIKSNCKTAKDFLVQMRVEYEKCSQEEKPFKGIYLMNKGEIEKANESVPASDKEVKEGFKALIELGESA